jgi:hypothetical protein
MAPAHCDSTAHQRQPEYHSTSRIGDDRHQYFCGPDAGVGDWSAL